MRLVMTLLVRDEEDIVDAQLAFHLSAGVDFVVAIDHDSRDATTEILEKYVSQGSLHRIPKTGTIREIEWRTHLARIAASAFAADWVLNSDADQFWWPQGGDLKEVLDEVPRRYGSIRAFDRVFIPRPDDGSHFAERMTVRLAAPAPINSPASTFRPLLRVVHRADAGVRVARGSHSISGADLAVLPSWHPLEVLHFPWRSPTQLARKAPHLWSAFADDTRQPTAYHADAYRAVRRGRAEDHYARLAVDDDDLRRGLDDLSVVRDVRVRDALRALAGEARLDEDPAPRFTTSPATGRLSFGSPTAPEKARYAAEADALREAELVRARRRLDDLDRRISRVESGIFTKADR